LRHALLTLLGSGGRSWYSLLLIVLPNYIITRLVTIILIVKAPLLCVLGVPISRILSLVDR
jgi:hypothetical protein